MQFHNEKRLHYGLKNLNVFQSVLKGVGNCPDPSSVFLAGSAGRRLLQYEADRSLISQRIW
jgi:hypothetical protein